MDAAITSVAEPRAPALAGGRLAAWVAILSLILYLVLAGGGASAGTLYAQYRLVSEAILGVLIVVWTIVAWRHPEWRPASSIWLAILGVLVAFMIATVLSWNVRLSVEYLAYAVLLAALYLLLVRLLADPTFGPRILTITAILAGTIALLYIGRVVMHWIAWWEAVGHVTTPPLRPGFESLMFGNPSAVAAVTILLLSPAMAWLTTRGRAAGIAAVILVGLVGTAVLLSGSRGAWLGLGTALAATLLLAFIRRESRQQILARARGLSRPALIALLAAIAVIAVVIGPAIARRALAGGGDELRLSLSVTALRMFADDPLSGTGPGTWVVRRAAFTEPDEIDFYIPHAHNVPAQGLAEFGIVGLLAAGIAVIVVGRLVWSGLASETGLRRRIAWAAVFSLTYFAVHQLVDSYMNMPAMLFAAVLPVAFLDGSAPADFGRFRLRSSGATSIRTGKAGVALLAMACLVAIGLLIRIDTTALTATEAARLADASDWERAALLARRASADDPGLPAYTFLAGLTAAHLNPADGLDALRESAAAEDYPQSWLDVAALEQAAGDPTSARASLDRAMRLGRAQPAISLPAGAMYLELGDRTAAVEAFAEALAVAPGLTDDPFWTGDAVLGEAWTAAVDQAIETAPPRNAARIALLAERADQARAIAATLPDADREVLMLAIDGWLGDPAARSSLEQIAIERPLDNRAVIWSALLAEHVGDMAAHDRYRRWAAITSGTLGSEIGDDIVVTDTPHVGQQVPGPNANLQGWFVYRRPYPWDLLVPGLPKLTVE